MASFVVDLWESIFTPGPTPSLLAATNATFACLQLLLFCLLVFSYSVHFVVLSGLCAGLWWSINWFTTELKRVQRQQEAEDARTRREAAAASPATDDSGTEVEEAVVGRGRRKARSAATVVSGGGGGGAGDSGDATAIESVATSTATEPMMQPAGDIEQRQQHQPGLSDTGTQSSVSTEDEWEKVSESEKDK